MPNSHAKNTRKQTHTYSLPTHTHALTLTLARTHSLSRSLLFSLSLLARSHAHTTGYENMFPFPVSEMNSNPDGSSPPQPVDPLSPQSTAFPLPGGVQPLLSGAHPSLSQRPKLKTNGLFLQRLRLTAEGTIHEEDLEGTTDPMENNNPSGGRIPSRPSMGTQMHGGRVGYKTRVPSSKSVDDQLMMTSQHHAASPEEMTSLDESGE